VESGKQRNAARPKNQDVSVVTLDVAFEGMLYHLQEK
jgi:hypothetical protein